MLTYGSTSLTLPDPLPTTTLGKGLVALVHSTSSIPSRSQGEVTVAVVVVSNLGLSQPLHQLISAVPRLPRTGMGQWNLLQIRCQTLGFMKGLQDE